MTATERECRAAHARATYYATAAKVDPAYGAVAATWYVCAANHAAGIVAESTDPAQIKRYERNAAYWRLLAESLDDAARAARQA